MSTAAAKKSKAEDVTNCFGFDDDEDEEVNNADSVSRDRGTHRYYLILRCQNSTLSSFLVK